MDLTALFHPAVAAWFSRSFPAPTAAQAQAWPAIKAGRHVLVAAPTGSGKTLAAFLAAIDGLVRQGVEGPLANETQVVYVSPLKALSNDIQRNLEAPLAGIREALRAQGLPDVDIRTWVRTGDTPPGERDRMRRTPPHIVVTTPESLYILLGSESGRAMLATTRTVIVDEIHALAPNKRGTHLSLSLERLAALCGDRLLRIGLSATQKPVETVARFLVGAGADGEPSPACTIIDIGHRRARDLALEIPSSPLEAGDVGRRLAAALRPAGRADRGASHHAHLRQYPPAGRAGDPRAVRAPRRRAGDRAPRQHGQGAAARRRAAAQGAASSRRWWRPPRSSSASTSATSISSASSARRARSRASCSGSGAPATRSTARPRAGCSRSRATSWSNARRCSTACGAASSIGWRCPSSRSTCWRSRSSPRSPAREWNEDELYARLRRAWPYRALPREDFDAVVDMLAEGFSTRRGRRGALIHYDAVNHVLRGRRGARLTALTSGGTIPDNADYQVLLEPENQIIGTVNEDFAVESMAGDVFQLGNTSYRILRVERGVVRVEDAHGMAPTIPFWLGEAPGRSDELSQSVSRLRAEIAARLSSRPDRRSVRCAGSRTRSASTRPPPMQLIEYLTSAHAALGCLPTQDTVVLERFFDEAGGMQLVIHSPYGSRLNRAWGLALRKRFCRKFNFELQAAATEDNIVLSLTTAHSFELADVSRYLHSASVRPVLIQAHARCADVQDALALGGRRRAGAAALPRRPQGAAAARPHGRRRPDRRRCFPTRSPAPRTSSASARSPTIRWCARPSADCLTEAMDIEGLERLLAGLEAGAVRVVTLRPDRALPARARGAVGAALRVSRRRAAGGAPHAGGDGPALARAGAGVRSRPARSRGDRARAVGSLARCRQCRRAARRAGLARFPDRGGGRGRRLAGAHGSTSSPGRSAWRGSQAPSASLWITAERLPQFRALWPAASLEPAIAAPDAYATRQWSRDEALVEVAARSTGGPGTGHAGRARGRARDATR